MFSVWLFLTVVQCVVIRYEAAGGKVGDDALDTVWSNGRLLNTTLNALRPGDVFVVDAGKTFVTMGGIQVSNISNVVIRIDGTLEYTDKITEWPRSPKGGVLPAMNLVNVTNVTITSASDRGVIRGNGNVWWWLPFLGYVKHEEDRPRLLQSRSSSNLLVEKLLFLNPPYWTTYFRHCDGLIIRYCDISARRTSADGHSAIDMSAFNTDGFDFSGKNIHVHDVTVYSQDDCITVKDGTENVLVERVNASGVGLTVGSIGDTINRNITFRDCYLHNSHKGLYMKFREGHGRSGVIADVLYENITIDNNEQWAIWIGPAQQSDTTSLCAAHPCSICWPTVPGTVCNAPPNKLFANLTLRNINIRNPQQSPGVILGHPATPIENLVFDNVRVTTCVSETSVFAQTFPRLPTDISDSYITYFGLFCTALVLLVAVVPCSVCYFRGCCSRRYCQEHRKTKVCWASTALLLVLCLLLVLVRIIYVQVGTGNREEYFRCEGVKGVATGNTWPVPSCLEDKTDSNKDVTELSSCPSMVPVIVVFGCVAGVLFVVLALKKWAPARYTKYKSMLDARFATLAGVLCYCQWCPCNRRVPVQYEALDLDYHPEPMRPSHTIN